MFYCKNTVPFSPELAGVSGFNLRVFCVNVVSTLTRAPQPPLQLHDAATGTAHRPAKLAFRCTLATVRRRSFSGQKVAHDLVEPANIAKGSFDYGEQGLPVRRARAFRFSDVKIVEDGRACQPVVDRSQDDPLARLANLDPGEELSGAPAITPPTRDVSTYSTRAPTDSSARTQQWFELGSRCSARPRTTGVRISCGW